jgi:hypothetical protein
MRSRPFALWRPWAGLHHSSLQFFFAVFCCLSLKSRKSTVCFLLVLNPFTYRYLSTNFSSLTFTTVLSTPEIAANTALSASDITAILAINKRAAQQAGRGAEVIQGGHRYPGQAVVTTHAYDET